MAAEAGAGNDNNAERKTEESDHEKGEKCNKY